MDIRTNSKNAAKAIVKALDVLTFSPAVAAQTITKAPGPIQHRLFLTIKAIIHLWAIDAKNRTFDPEFGDIYRWAKEHDDNG